VNSYTAHDTASSREVVSSDRSRGPSVTRAPVRRSSDSRPEEAISKKKAKKARKEREQANGALATESMRTKPDPKVRYYDAHVLICKGGDCKKRGSKDVRKALKNELRERGMAGDVRVDSVECFGLCKHGPNAVVYPDGTWYLGLGKDDAPEVVERHLEGGEPVERLAAGFRPRKKKE
jgi:(2Fe-2S) ferredoxin